MASGVTVLPSTSAGGKPSDGSRQKRKIAAGLPNVRKRVCVPKDAVKVEAARSAGSSKPFVTKRKDRIDDENTGDSSLELDAARALTQMQTQVLKIIEERPVLTLKVVAPLPQWSRKRIRSSRAKRADCASDDSHTSEPEPEQQSEGASSLGKDSHSAITTAVKVEAPSGSVEQGCASDTEKQNIKLLSDSSCDFHQLDSRAESPTSPLPASVRIDEVPGFTAFQMVENEPRSAFRKVVAIRPVKKAAVARKPKVEEKSYEAATPEQAAVKLATRKKPKPAGVGQLPIVKTEEADAGWPVSSTAVVLNEDSRRFEDAKCANAANPCMAAAQEVALSEPVLVKIETKPSVKPGQRAGGKLKPAISESEKEARRQRRVQANRESARQTIRRKQVLCEELSQKAQLYTIDNDTLKKELEMKLLDLKKESELNARLREQLLKSHEGVSGSEVAATQPEHGSAFRFNPPSSGTFNPMILMQFPHYTHPSDVCFPGAPPPLGLSGDYATAAVSYMPVMWTGGAHGGQGPLVSYFPYACPVAGSSKFTSPRGEEATSPPASSSGPAASLPSTQAESPFSKAPCGRDRGLVTAKSLGPYRASSFSESTFSHDVKKASVKCESVCEAPTFGGKGQFYKLTTSSQHGTSCLPGVLPRKSSGEELLCLPPPSAHLARASSGNLAPQVSKMGNSRFVFPSGGRRYSDMMGQELPQMMQSQKPSVAVARAAEARRNRIELQRSRAQRQQAARIAEPSVS
ncbi:protein MpBZIP5 [Marchantia polymorpha subsp. ruderalis]|nr:hypothetical protein MARPO_0016s0098 [Marchantia polymorpha]PTQ45042.1 hypothetical protein MARPO_0016s0098 [Marchantia polymorpha]BBN14307.1 hypothetical protein Mp_6g10570 [Marchantia polymorpha subsp. ruderalis]BBN14308.1 hypothetical protein Mp_6g10570 [Marchantia polymorpha subsp. ruderalis]|eukprot:PTQ45041.1 hypothetical protein MARPO_0016s0098 [Marchantia polymorpha]